MAKKVVEAEGGELVLQNEAGDTIIVPKNNRSKALKMLENNDHAGIDGLAGGLPYMEDYAEDGTLIPDNPIMAQRGFLGKGKPVDSQPTTASAAAALEGLKEQGVGQVTPELEVPAVEQDLATLDELEPYRAEFGDKPVTIPEGRYIKSAEAEAKTKEWKAANKAFAAKQDLAGGTLTAPFDVPNPGEQGCLGSACRIRMGDAPSYYDIRQKAGIHTVQTGVEEEIGSGYESIDSWELAGVAEETGIGTNFMKPTKSAGDFKGDYADSDFDVSMQGIRKEAAEKFQDVPVGSILTTGVAEGIYTEKGAKTILKQRGKKAKEITQKVRPRHSIKYWGVDPDTGDYLFYDYGKLETVKPDQESVEKFLNDKQVMYVTSLKDQGDWSKAKLERAQKFNRSLGSQ